MLTSKGAPHHARRVLQSRLGAASTAARRLLLAARVCGMAEAVINPPDKGAKRVWAADDMLVVLAED